MSGKDEHSPQRLIKAQQAVEAAERTVDDLIEPLAIACEQLCLWRKNPVGFREDKPDGTSSIPQTANQINLNEMPFLKPIAEAMTAYNKAVAELRLATEAQRLGTTPSQTQG